MIGGDKIVEFDKYCEKCLYFDKEDYEDPCNECLSTPVNQDSHSPVRFRKKEKE